HLYLHSFPTRRSSDLIMKLILVLIAAIGGQACQRDITVRQVHNHGKRESTNVTFPPVLDANEQILINSFDNISISTWSYYYSKRSEEHTSELQSPCNL